MLSFACWIREYRGDVEEGTGARCRGGLDGGNVIKVALEEFDTWGLGKTLRGRGGGVPDECMDSDR